MKYPRTGQRGAPQAFARKLYEILEVEPGDLLSWNAAGNAFFVRDIDRFSKEILMKYFRHSKFASFQRQLNLYGFRKITRGSDAGSYAHQYFRKGKPDLLSLVRRSQSSSSPSPPHPAHGFALHQDGDFLKPQINAMYQLGMGNFMTNREMMRNSAISHPFSVPHTNMNSNVTQRLYSSTSDNLVRDDPVPVVPYHQALGWHQPQVQTVGGEPHQGVIDPQSLFGLQQQPSYYPKLYSSDAVPINMISSQHQMEGSSIHHPESLMVSDPVHLVRKIYQDAAAPAEEAVEDDKDQEESKDSIIARLQTSFSNAIKGLSSTPGDPLGGSGCGLPTAANFGAPTPPRGGGEGGAATTGGPLGHPPHHLQPVNIQMLADSLYGPPGAGGAHPPPPPGYAHHPHPHAHLEAEARSIWT
mmetsp:Transcript_7708/g.12888  ORF Transcript_7708/g.12888 Transcript_7708/m.12888 type:complete len:413 (+) Transcript_7708:178-1416(+)